MASAALAGETYYVAPDGADSNRGTIESPLGSIQQTVDRARAGDTIYLRGGTYKLDRALRLRAAGTADEPIRLFAMAGESPILDFSDNPRHANPPQPRKNDSIAATGDALGIHIDGRARYWHLKGLTVQNAAYYGIRIYGSHNTVEQVSTRYNKASGLEITGKDGARPSHNLILNTDSYLNFDAQGNGEDADGFAAKFESLGPGNVFRGVRAWSNSDDGFDFWHAAHPVVIEDSWAFDNGFHRPQWKAQISGRFQGDGMGFKLGQEAAQIILNRVAAWGNKGMGIDENGNRSRTGVVIAHATVVNNGKDGSPLQISLNDGRPHTITNTIAFDVDGTAVVQFDNAVKDTSNTWNGIGVSAADFVDLDMASLFTAATGPRKEDGSLPEIGLRLADDSRLIDAGADAGLPYHGDAPDLGAFESDAAN